MIHSRGGAAPSPRPRPFSRGVYLNIASPVPGLTVHDWSEQRWSDYLDNIRQAGADTLTFYLWQDILSDFESTPERREPNRRLHERLRDVIAWARKRKLRTSFLMTPTFVPRPIFERHPELRATIEYVDHGFSCICPSRDATWPLLERYVDHEWGWFHTADAFQLWFYDPGGCVCDRCTADLCAPLLRQADVVSKRVWAKNPSAKFEISFWPVWAWEQILKRKFGEELLDRLHKHFGERSREIVIVDSAEGDEAFLEEAKARGFHTRAFLFSANVETPFAFLHPLPTYFQQMAERVHAKELDGAFLHALYPGSKEVNTLAGLRALDGRNRGNKPAALYDAARIYLKDRRCADQVVPLLQRWETVLAGGKPDPKTLQRLVDDLENALATAPAAQADVLLTSVRAVLVLASEPEATRAAKLESLLENSPMFRGFAKQAAAQHASLARFVHDGWDKVHF